MGKGNVYVSGKYEGVFYVDNDFIDIYDEVRTYNEEASYFSYLDFVFCFKESFKDRFSSFADSDEWIGREQRVVLENQLFYIALEDNDWSIAVELIQKDEPEGLQKMLYSIYFDGIKNILLDMFGSSGQAPVIIRRQSKKGLIT